LDSSLGAFTSRILASGDSGKKVKTQKNIQFWTEPPDFLRKIQDLLLSPDGQMIHLA